MENFNVKLAKYLDDEMIAKIGNESRKPVSLRAIARKFNLSVYAVKRLIKYARSIEHNQ